MPMRECPGRRPTRTVRPEPEVLHLATGWARRAMGPGGLGRLQPRRWGDLAHPQRCREFGQLLATLGFTPHPWCGKTRVAYWHPPTDHVLKIALFPELAFLATEEQRVLCRVRRERPHLAVHFPPTVILAPGVQWQALVDTRNSGTAALDRRYSERCFRQARGLARQLGVTDVHGDNFGYAPDGQRIRFLDWITRPAMRHLRRVLGVLTGDPGGSFLSREEDC